MALRNSAEKWGAVARFFHWTIALAILAVFIVGVVMEDVAGPQKYQVYLMHKSAGLLILLLVLCRIVWRLANPAPKPVSGDPHWQVVMADLVHWGLYALMLAVPLSGWLTNSYAGYPIKWFGFENMLVPQLVAPDQAMRGEVGELHEALAFAIMALAAVHAGAALYHHFVRKDAILARMTPFVRQK